MKEKEPYRSFFVSYNQNRCIQWMTRQEIMSLASEGKLDWIVYNGQRIEGMEINLLQSYLVLKNEDPSKSPSNVDLAFHMSQFRTEPISRNEVSRLRNQVRLKLKLKGGW